MSELTDKQKRFCEEYVFDWNGTQAAIRAGYSENSARQIASENLSKPDISAYIEELKSKTEQLAGISKLRIAKGLAAIAFTDLTDVINQDGELKPFEELTDAQKSALASVKIEKRILEFGEVEKKEFKMCDKIAAYRELKKMFGYDSPEKHEHTFDELPISNIIISGSAKSQRSETE